MEETKFKKEELVKIIHENIQQIEKNILTLDAERNKAKELLGLIKLYIGNETLQIKMVMSVNLHQIKTETMLSTNVSNYKEILEKKVKEVTVEIEAYGKMLEELAEKLGEDENGTETTT